MGAYEFQGHRLLFVDDDAAGKNDGSSWADAFNYLQDALAACCSSDEIHVAQGIYKPDQGAGITPGDREATFQLINGVTLKGGYAGFGEPNPNARDIELYETILSGDLNGNDVEVADPLDLLRHPSLSENSYHVVTGSGTNDMAVLDAFSISGGNANEYYPFARVVGGGMWNYLGSPIVTNCVFKDNAARVYGGGMYNEQSSPTLFNCKFRCNAAEGSGSGMCNRESSNPTVTNCTFSFNVGLSYHDSFGVGMYNYESNPTVNNCAFTGNSGSLGAGMYNYDSNPILKSCTFTGNMVHEGGGGMRNLGSSPTLINCTFSGNWSDWYGVGGMENCHNSTPTLTNCILWNDMPGEISGPAVVTYSNVQGSRPGAGNIDTDPFFVSLGYWDTNDTPDKHWDDFWVEGDYHLLLSSPCIDAGDPSYIAEPNETDLDGKSRVIGGRIDMGAYEYGQLISAEARIAPRTINLASKGNWITSYIWLPDEYDVADIEPNSIFLEDEIQPEDSSVDQQKQVATATFDREKVQSILNVGDIELTITCQLTDGTSFEATDTIKVTDKAGK
jgi:hypothetical protein